ncbi:hypothetical protein CVA01_24700 [Corynebacterium variabile]|uniref:Uncharacterized protein n=1 Tax=Corynebacterium variabile TaxID=1727 RepID=A0A4Y4C4S5_9CORY|nr:hypothetical protein CVA01_24700 [Corynebacterium variabile]
MRTMFQSVFDQETPDRVWAQARAVVDMLDDKLPKAASHLEEALDEILAFTAFSEAGVDEGVVQQSDGAVEQGDPLADQCREDLP